MKKSKFALRLQPKSSCALQQSPDGLFELRQFLFNDSPNDFQVHAEIIVNDFVAHAGELLPRDFWFARPCFVRELLDSLADDFERAQRGVPSHALGEERVAPCAGVRGDVSESIADMLQIDAVVAHSAWASVRIRSCR